MTSSADMSPIHDDDENGFERVPLPSLDRGADIQDRAGFQVNVKALRPPTAQELEDIRQVAYLEGYEEGKQAGFQSSRKEGYEVGEKEGRKAGQLQGLEESQARVTENLQALSRVMYALTDPVKQQEQEAVQAVSQLAISLTRSLLHRELHIDSSQVEALALSVLQELPSDAKNVKLRVSPEDRPLLDQALIEHDQKPQILADPKIQRGGCIVETHSQLIDYTVETAFQRQITAMLDSLLEANQSAKPVPQDDAHIGSDEYPTELLEPASSVQPSVTDPNNAEPSQPPASNENDEPSI